MPRWLTGFNGRHQYESGSRFLSYHYFFYNYAKNHPDITLILRPHHLLFDRGVVDKYLSQEDLDAIFSRFAKLKNVIISEHKLVSLVDDILQADIIVSEGSSALAEAVVADKPIIYLSNGIDKEFESNQLSEKFKNFLYLSYTPNDVIKSLALIKNNSYKPYKANQKQAYIEFKQDLDPVNDPVLYIARYLKESIDSKHK